MELFNLSNLTFRKLSLLDIKEFKAAATESIETNHEYLAFGALFKDINPLEYVSMFLQMLKSSVANHYGLFDGGTLLGHVCNQRGFSDLGIELIGWTRSSYQNLGVGEVGLKVATEGALNSLGINFVQLSIDQKNIASRKVAEKVGFIPVLKIPYESSSIDSYILYLKLSPRAIRLARQYARRPMDVMCCPATALGLSHFLSSDRIIEFYEWPFPPFDEGCRPTNPYYFEDYVARVNFSPRNLESEN